MNSTQRHRRFSAVIALLITMFVYLWACSGGNLPQKGETLTNLAHLNHLFEKINKDNQEMAIIHIYSEAPDYKWVGDEDEGIACVDDAARAVVVYLRHFEVFGDTTSLVRARLILKFILSMQAQNGLFYNFLWPDYSINKEGKNSQNQLNWWTARAIWGLGYGYKTFFKTDSLFADSLRRAIRRVFPHLDTLLQRYPVVREYKRFPVPQWLLANSAADATSELMLGLLQYWRVTKSRQVEQYLRKFADGCSRMQQGNANEFPFGAFLSWKNVWHAWGNSQATVLLNLGNEIKEPAYSRAARLEIDGFYPYIARRGFLREIIFHQPINEQNCQVSQFSQIAYNIRPMFMATLDLYRLTGKQKYAKAAVQYAAWFFGGNSAGQQMYDAKTGRGFDGIGENNRVNFNAGAESTLEALMVMLELDSAPEVKKLFNVQLQRALKGN